MDRSTWVEVDVSALKHNFGLVSEDAGVPVCAVREPLSCQSFSNRAVQLSAAKREPAVPTCDVSTQFMSKEWRRSKLERPRSAARSCQF